jgi:lysylphosphatidylglycerol synthetase-like protein (DUF2156 family)
MRRRTDSLTGSTEFLVVKAVERARARGDAMITLSLSALAKVPDDPRELAEGSTTAPPVASDNPAGDDRAREFLMETLARYYDFKNLFRWKRKFNPAFEDRFLVYPDTLALPRVARALLRAQTPAGLLSYFRRAG